MRKVGAWVAGIVVGWLVVLAVFGMVYGGRAGDRVAGRVADSLGATVTIEDTNLKMVRGGIVLEGFKARKDDLGHLALDVASIDCDLPPLGLVLFDRVCSDLVIDEVRLEVSALAVFRFQKPKKKPFRTEHVTIRDARLAFSPSAFVPGLGKIEIQVDAVEAGPTVFKTPLSWIFAMEELHATLDLPGSIVVELHYKAGVLRARGGVFGSSPVEIPLALPVADASDDAQAEISKLVAFGRNLAEQLAVRRAEDWIRSKLSF